MKRLIIPLLISMSLTACGGGGGGGDGGGSGGSNEQPNVPDSTIDPVPVPKLQALYTLWTDTRLNHTPITVDTNEKTSDGLRDRYEPSYQWDYVDIDIHGDGDRDVLIQHTDWIDNEDQTYVNANAYLLINNGEEEFTLEKLDIGFTGRIYEVADVNGDGLEDLYMPLHGYELYGSGGGAQDHLWIQQNDGTFLDEFKTHLPQRIDFGHGSCVGDFRGIGVNDIIAVNMFSYDDSGNKQSGEVNYYVNDGNGVYHDSRDDAIPLASLPTTPHSGSWCTITDHNGDGFLDALVTTVTAHPNTHDGRQPQNGANMLFINDGTGHFTVEYVYLSEMGISVDDYVKGEDKNGNYDYDESIFDTGMGISFDANGDECDDVLMSAFYFQDGIQKNFIQVWESSCNDIPDTPKYITGHKVELTSTVLDGTFFDIREQGNNEFIAVSWGNAKNITYDSVNGFTVTDVNSFSDWKSISYAAMLYASETIF